MLRFTFVPMGILCAAWAGEALALTPFVETHHHPYQSGAELGLFEVTSSTYVDIPGTTKTVTAPPGQAVIMWTVGRTNAAYAMIRPVIGPNAQASPPIQHQNTGANEGNLSGSWSTMIEGGTLNVKLQAALSPDFSGLSAFQCEPDFGTSWTLAVFPSTAEGAPAMSTAGLAAAAVLILVGGMIVLAARHRTAQAN